MKKKKQKKAVKNKINKKNFIRIDKSNIEFLKAICSKSSIDWHELYYVNANKYFTCLQIYELMENSYRGFFNSIIDKENVLVTCDVEHLDNVDYAEKFDGIINKYDNQKNDTKKFSKFKKATKNQEEVIAFDSELEYTKDEVKLMTIRVYVFDSTLEKLQERLDKLINHLSALGGVRGYVQVNDLFSDYQALTMLDNPVQKMVASGTVADYLIKSEVNRVDKHASLIGYTANGNYAPDFFNFENSSYNAIFLGGTGSGKSALLKLFEETRRNYNDHIAYLFDIHQEYDEYCKENEIDSVSIDEHESVNIMQIFSVSNNKGDDVIRENDVQTQIAMIKGRFDTLNNFNREQTLKQLGLHLKAIYEPYIDTRLSEYSDDDWCILEDVLKIVHDKIQQNEYRDVEQEDIYNVELGLKEMIDSYGYLFNRKTTMNFNLDKSLRFDFSFLKDNDDTYLKSSYVSLLMSYVRRGIFMNAVYNQRIAKENGVHMHELNRPYRTLNIVVDETAQYSEKSFLQNVNSCIKLARKCYTGMTFVFHGIKDIKKVSSACADDLEELFELCTNKIIGICDGETINELPRYVVGLTNRDMGTISTFEKGPHGERTFLAIDDKKRKTVFTSIVTPQQRTYFKGGV
ncbi:MAG: hypothetical protein EOM50_07060 [Erysipelotrichia bacterium]|nr:hypothetical protein [Erysipelotrichia bacterium]NCC55024.1 hypothetical protein [Erysipelotrichia bacterium]